MHIINWYIVGDDVKTVPKTNLPVSKRGIRFLYKKYYYIVQYSNL